MHQQMAATLDEVLSEIRAVQRRARVEVDTSRPRWPMIVLRTPKGWTGPVEVDGVPVEGTWRSHQVPLAGLAQRPDHLAALEAWLRSYRPEELFDESGGAAGRAGRAGTQG
jgi:xylulose-5-phosphate/fructose-6-phosphate phosphoketolase